MKSLDTNIILKLFTREVPDLATRIEQTIASSKANSYAVADVVFAEVVWVLSRPPYEYNRELIVELLGGLTASRQINCNRSMLSIALPLYVKDHGISYVDATLVAYARLNNATPLLSRDRKLTRIADVEFFE